MLLKHYRLIVVALLLALAWITHPANAQTAGDDFTLADAITTMNSGTTSLVSLTDRHIHLTGLTPIPAVNASDVVLDLTGTTIEIHPSFVPGAYNALLFVEYAFRADIKGGRFIYHDGHTVTTHIVWGRAFISRHMNSTIADGPTLFQFGVSATVYPQRLTLRDIDGDYSGGMGGPIISFRRAIATRIVDSNFVALFGASQLVRIAPQSADEFLDDVRITNSGFQARPGSPAKHGLHLNVTHGKVVNLRVTDTHFDHTETSSITLYAGPNPDARANGPGAIKYLTLTSVRASSHQHFAGPGYSISAYRAHSVPWVGITIRDPFFVTDRARGWGTAYNKNVPAALRPSIRVYNER